MMVFYCIVISQCLTGTVVTRQRLAKFERRPEIAAASRIKIVLWYGLSWLVFESGLMPLSRIKCRLLRAFGATIGAGLVMKPNVRVKFPWKLTVGNNCWIGQDVWIDNLAEVTLGDDVCLSQGAYLCTGSHDIRKESFDLITRPVRVERGAWIGAKAILLPGTTIGAGTVVAAGSVVRGAIGEDALIAGNPAEVVGARP